MLKIDDFGKRLHTCPAPVDLPGEAWYTNTAKCYRIYDPKELLGYGGSTNATPTEYYADPRVVATLLLYAPELDIAEALRPANRIGWNDPRAVKTARNKILVWSTNYAYDKTRYDLARYMDTEAPFYKITQRDGAWNNGYPLEGALTVSNLMINPVHGHDDTDWDYKVWYGPSSADRQRFGPYEIYVVSETDYEKSKSRFDIMALPFLTAWADAVYKRFREGHWRTSGTETNWIPTGYDTATFIAEQPEENVPYADLTHKLGAVSYERLSPEIINGRRYPRTRVTVPVYFWEYDEATGHTNVSKLFLGDKRVEKVIKAFIEQIPYSDLNARYENAGTGTVRTVRWEFSMEDHHKLYWIDPTDSPIPSLTGGNDTLLNALPLGDPLALGDVWVVGSDPANGLYGGGGYIDLKVEKLPSGDLKVQEDPFINMTVEDMFDFNYWNGNLISQFPIKAAASIQCAHGRPTIPAGVGDVALLRFEVQGTVYNIGDILINKP